jgi:hypothetical protein
LAKREVRLSIENHLSELRRKHRELDDSIEYLEKHSPGRCSLRLKELKKQKLQLKDEITSIESSGAEIVALWPGVEHGDLCIDDFPIDDIRAVG